MKFQIQSTFALLLMVVLSHSDSTTGLAQAFNLKKCNRTCKMRRWAPKMVKKCIKNCKKQDKESRKNNENSNDSLLGKRRELGKVIDEPLAIDREMCLGRCDTRLLAPQGKARCLKKCERQRKNNKNTTDKNNGNKRENKEEKFNEKRYRCRSTCRRKKFSPQRITRCLNECG